MATQSNMAENPHIFVMGTPMQMTTGSQTGFEETKTQQIQSATLNTQVSAP